MTKAVRLGAAVLALLLATAAAKPPSAPPSPGAELMAVDRAFSKLSVEKGHDYAFLAYIATDGRLYGTGKEPPVYGRAQAFRRLARPDSGALSRVPESARVAADGKMGWTDGHWRYVARGAKAASTGHYLTVWVRERRGWRVEADMGTSDPAPKK